MQSKSLIKCVRWIPWLMQNKSYTTRCGVVWRDVVCVTHDDVPLTVLEAVSVVESEMSRHFYGLGGQLSVSRIISCVMMADTVKIMNE